LSMRRKQFGVAPADTPAQELRGVLDRKNFSGVTAKDKTRRVLETLRVYFIFLALHRLVTQLLNRHSC
jgi:hypothetical protein